MKIFASATLFLALCASAFAQQWEVGGLGGGGFLNTVPVSGAGASANAGFQNGAMGGGYFGQNLYPRLSGEIHYDFFQSNLSLSSGGTSASFSGVAHSLHYDLVFHTRRKNSPVQFFVAVGGGMKLFQGTGTEEAYQPLYQYGYFTKTHAFEPMGTVGVGLTYRLAARMFLRAEMRDFITPFPTAVLTPPPGASYRSILQDFVPMVGITYVF